MERKWVWKVVFTLFLFALAIAASVTTVKKSKDGGGAIPDALYDIFPGINLGLDLQGGLRLIYEVEVEAAIEDKRDHIA